MFYSTEILSLKSNNSIGVVWYAWPLLCALLCRLAATLGPKCQARKLTRRDFGGVNLVETCRFLSCPPEPLSLRLQSNLMVGVSRVYGQQIAFYYSDVQGLWTRVAKMNEAGQPGMRHARAK